MKKLFAGKNQDLHGLYGINLALNLLLSSIALNYLDPAFAAELKYKGNAEVTIALVEGVSSRELDSDRLSLEYTEAIAPIIVADAEAKADKFLLDSVNVADSEQILTRMTAIGKYAAQVDYGLLQGVSQTEIQTSAPQSDKLPILSGKASAVQNLSWSDKLTVSSSTLPKGKTVRLKFTLKFSRYLSQDNLGEVKAVALFGIYPSDSTKRIEISISSDRDRAEETTTESQIIDVKVGQTLNLIGKLELLAKSTHPNSQKLPPIASAVAQAEDSAKFYIDPIEADISYTTESGHQYLSNVRQGDRDGRIDKLLSN